MQRTGVVMPVWLLSVPAGILCGVLIWRRTRRRLRAKNALCPTCSYDLRDHPPGATCPECGTPIPAKPVR